MKVAKLMASNSHRCTLLRRYEAAAYQIANEPETMEESNEDDSAHVGVGNVSRDESFLSELEQKQEVLSRINMEIDSDGDDEYSRSNKDGAQEDGEGER